MILSGWDGTDQWSAAEYPYMVQERRTRYDSIWRTPRPTHSTQALAPCATHPIAQQTLLALIDAELDEYPPVETGDVVTVAVARALLTNGTLEVGRQITIGNLTYRIIDRRSDDALVR